MRMGVTEAGTFLNIKEFMVVKFSDYWKDISCKMLFMFAYKFSLRRVEKWIAIVQYVNFVCLLKIIHTFSVADSFKEGWEKE